MAAVKLTYYLDVLSSWCLIAEDALDKVRAEFGSQLDYEWKIVQLNDAAPFHESLEKYAWYYRRTKHVTGVQLNSTWREGPQDSTLYPNLAAEAARSLGAKDDRVRRAISRATMIDGKHGSRREVALEIAAQAGALDPAALDRALEDRRTIGRTIASTVEFRKLPVDVVPTFVISNTVGDRAILSGLYQYETIASVVREMLHAATRYAEFMAREPEPGG